jgi:DNA-binding NarL/FixJ family response regulator
MSLRLMIVSDDPLSASALRRALRATAAFDVIDGYAEGRGPCAAVAAAHRPDVVVVDQMESRPDTLARISEIRVSLPDAKIVLLPARMEPAWLTEAASAGADAAIAKTFRLEGLGALVREVAAGNVFHAFDAPRAPLRAAAGSTLPTLPALTDRELEVLRLVAAGAPNSRIAAQLWITEQTVKFHLSKVYRKLGVSNRTEASHHAYVHGLFEATPGTGVAA